MVHHRLFAFSARKAQRGQGVIEIIGSLIIFTIMLSLMMSISVYLYVQHAMVSVAREGTRFASLNTEIGATATQQAGIDATVAYVKSSAASIAGTQLTTSEISVTAPSATGVTGQRTVAVTISHDMNNPVNIAGFLDALGADGSSFETIPVSATATMRYEE